MFFADPAAAFANIGRALRPGARLVQLVWQGGDRQEWVIEIGAALSVGTPAPATGGALSLGDPGTVREILGAAGFAKITVNELSEPIHYGDQAEAYDFVTGFEPVRALLAGLAPEDVPAAQDRLRAMLAAHDTDTGVWFDSRAWLVEAHRP
jgi:hypothetical protein